MKKVYSLLFVAILFTIFALTAQDTSYQVKKIDGKNYILYPVQAGEGMYGIARKFNVAYSDLNTLNPEATTGLKTGQILLIPSSAKINSAAVAAVKKATSTPESAVKTSITAKNSDKKEYIVHVVEKKQTLFAISKLYNISQEELMRINPELENGLKTGMKLNIPKPKAYTSEIVVSSQNSAEKAAVNKTPTTNETVKPTVTKKETKSSLFGSIFGKSKKHQKTETIKHLVKPKETLYAISKMYQVKMEDIVKQNPFTSEGLVIGTELTLDVPKEIADALPKTAPEVVKDTVVQPTLDETKYLTRVVKNIKPNTKAFKIAILLPVVIDNVKTDAVNERFQEFYAGFLIAANDAKNKGISLDIFTFDSGKSEESMNEALLNPDLKQVDLLIGPAYTNQISLVSDFARANKINTIIPFSSKVPDLDLNPYLFQFNPSLNIEIEYLTNLLNNKYAADNIVLVDIASVSAGDNGNTFLNELKSSLRSKNRSFNVVESTNELNIQTAMTFEKGKKNIVFFNTDKYSGVFPYFSFLNSKSSEFEIVLYEQYSWKNQNQQTKFQSFSVAPFKPLLNDTDFTDYNALFEKYFNWKISTANPRYDVIGYDLGNYFIALLYELGPKFSENRKKLPLASGVQSFIKFERTALNSGFINKQLYQHEK